MDTAFYIIGLIITVIICRFVFSIDTIVINLKAQTKLLVKIAEKSAVSREELIAIVGKGNKKMLSKESNSIERKPVSIE